MRGMPWKSELRLLSHKLTGYYPIREMINLFAGGRLLALPLGKKRRMLVLLTGSLLLAAIILSLFRFGLPGAAPVQARGESSISLEEMSENLEEQVPELMEYYDIPGAAVALIREGEVAWWQSFGYADREAQIPVTDETLFRAESITKSVTAWAVMNLVEAGRVDLEDPVERHLGGWQFPNSNFPSQEVTVRRLLSHSAGLSGGLTREPPGEERPPRQEVLEGKHGLPRAELVRSPGSGFEYSNQGFVALELMVEEVTGRDYQAYLQEEILGPLGVETFYFDIDEEASSNLATGYDYEGEPVPMYQDPFRGAGGLLISAEDLARFWAAGAAASDGQEPGKGVLQPESVKRLYTSEVKPDGFYALGSDGFGLGYFIDILPGAEKAVFHAGEGAGSLGQAYLVPQEGEGIVILTNSKRSWPLIYQLTGKWADWSGYSRPAMSQAYSTVQGVIWVLVALLLLGAAVKVVLLWWWLRAGHNCFAPFSPEKRFTRFLQVGLALMALLLWWLVGEMVVANLLPVIYGRLGLALGALAVSTLLTASFPPGDDRAKLTRV